VYRQPVTACTNPVLHGWLKTELTAILAALPAPTEPVDAAATRAAWQVWQDGLTAPFTLPEQLPPLRLLLVWDNLAGHKSTDMVVWLCQYGIMPLHTGVRHRTGRIARFVARIGNSFARLPVPIDLGPLGRKQTIDIAMGHFDPNRV
jgi:hypothetical protein